MTVPTPAVLRAQLSRREVSDEKFNVWCRGQLERSFRGIPALLEQLDRELDREITDWIADEGIDKVRAWLAPDTDAATLVRMWRTYVGEYPSPDRAFTLLATFVRESRVCGEIGTIAAFMHSNEGEIEAVVRRLRHDVALALVKNAYTIRFHLGVKLSRNCSLGRDYIQSVLGDDSSRSNRRLQRDYGKLAVISSRFGNASIAELKQARAYFHAVLEEEHDVAAAAYLIESAIAEYQLGGDQTVIVDTYMWAKDFGVPVGSWSNWWLVRGELMLHLAEASSRPEVRQTILREADEFLRRAQINQELEITQEVRAMLLRAMVDHLQDQPDLLDSLSLRGLRLPFGLRRRSALPEILLEASDGLAAALRPKARRGQFIYRDTLAGILTHTARASKGSRDKVVLLSEAIELRREVAGRPPLRDLRSRLDQAADYLLLAEHTALSQRRLQGLTNLVQLAREFPKSPDAFVAISNEVQRNGPAPFSSGDGADPLERLISLGDHAKILQWAAQIAISSRDFRKRELGGRGTSSTLEDPNSLSGQVFIVKQMTLDCYERDERRTRNTQDLLAVHKLETHFGVVEHVLEESLPPEEGQPPSVLSVRRFEQGKTLRQALADYTYNEPANYSAERCRDLLSPAVDYLALFHTDPKVEKGKISTRRNILVRELGCWLRQLPLDRDSAFAGWWELVADLPVVPRRDAHTQNWVVLSDDRLLAVDLESNGLRPLGYELAQLIDDSPVLATEDVGMRAELVERYVDAAAKYGMRFEFRDAWLGFQAAQAARAVSLLTGDRQDHAAVRHATGLLESLTHSATDQRLKSWCERVIRAWEIKAGRASPDTLAHFSESHRRRISKAMAFHLRHNPEAPLDREGWIYAEELSDLLRLSGLKVDHSTLIAVAGALGEPRFQLSGDSKEIRAAYGHSLRLQPIKKTSAVPYLLWHGTALSNLDGIFSARSGLIPGSRRHVHLSVSIEQARHVASRHSDQTVILQIDPKRVEDLFSPVAGMWLAPAVPARAVYLTSVWRLAESSGVLLDVS